MKYYFLSWKHIGRRHEVAYSNIELGPSYQLINTLDNISKLYFDFNIKDSLETKTGLIVNNPVEGRNYEWLDYMPNDLAWPLISGKMKAIIESNLAEKDYISWVSTNVILRNEEKTYYVLKFEKKIDVLNNEETIFVKGTNAIIKPVFSERKISDYSIFGKPADGDLWKITSSLYISETLKKSLQKEKCTGLDLVAVLVK